MHEEAPSLADDGGLIYSYVMEQNGHHARLDIRSDPEGQFEVMGSLTPDPPVRIGLITWIPIVATQGLFETFERFCAQGPSRVQATEPETLMWFYLKDKSHPGHYAIIDLYEGASGLEAHNRGEVAAALKREAATLVRGGWKAVLSGAIVYEVRSQA